MCMGTLIFPPLSVTALWTACLILKVSLVEKRKPFSGSNLSAARMSPMLPSWMRSPKGRPIPRYFFATGMTSLRFFSMSLDRAISSPSLALLPRSISSSWVRSLPRAICPKYLARGFGLSLSFILLTASRVILNPPGYALCCRRAVGSSGASSPHFPRATLLSGPRLYDHSRGRFLTSRSMCVVLTSSGYTEYLLLSVIGATVGGESGRVSALGERTHKRTMARRVAGTKPRQGARGPLRPARARAEGSPRQLRKWRRGQRRGLCPGGADQDNGQSGLLQGREPFHHLGSEDSHERGPHRAQAQALA